MCMNINQVILIFSFFLFASCVGYKKQLTKKIIDVEQARMIAIIDFANTYQTQEYYLEKRGGKPFDIFRIDDEIKSGDIVVILITPAINGILPISLSNLIGKVPENNFPNRYKIIEDKLFVWKDSLTPLNKEILDVLNTYNILDSTDIKRELGLLPDDFEDTRMVITDRRLKGVDYYICKNNVDKYKKVLTNIAYGYYEPPNLNCSE